MIIEDGNEVSEGQGYKWCSLDISYDALCTGVRTLTASAVYDVATCTDHAVTHVCVMHNTSTPAHRVCTRMHGICVHWTCQACEAVCMHEAKGSWMENDDGALLCDDAFWF